MKRRKFLQNAVVSTALLPTVAQANPPKKGFKVAALENRYKEHIVYRIWRKLRLNQIFYNT